MTGHSRIIEGDAAAKGVCVAIVAARFNAFVVDKLLSGALQALAAAGVRAGNIDVVRVPGAFEIPVAVNQAAVSRRYGAIIALGAVIRGETPHFDYVAGECARGIMRVMLDTHVPVGFGVLTCDTLEQAQTRAGGAAGNKGADAAQAALQMANLLQQLAH
ncbi:MAG: 6,7-dimethyl-8-ribityllumazine synthase [Gammaproteobacteria bacterium]|nr:6,7-dimethyl-8-ribityllumazine synthase [Gammaproteobacteria bacterium]MBU6509746.1 6,7-dimethyl-8-ribityllumazine synthase [Gammaproteobacteria bacterium]MDE1984460.1 6,7-dimethyl-8-ribityllumazine synthase [Gammaproteobacteria bacterium]MDE2109236.1 6,7-dimethyl-8-ribityllumazine synthase [Gammaproteobacteria bacterium]MDE2459885.1 6,7-dimethyl-8-ribityllumazine synthase [Gammaproteobacteria bacterium]